MAQHWVLNLATATPTELSAYLAQQRWWRGSTEVAQTGSAGAGNMNRVRRVTLTDGSSVILKQSSHAVERYPEIPAPIERIESEQQFYQRVAESKPVGERMPTIVGSDPDNHLLALTDLGTAEDASRWYAGASIAVITRVLPKLLEWLSQLHRLPADPPLNNRAMRALNHEHIFALPFASDSSLELGALQDSQLAIAADSGLKKIVSDLGECYLGNRSAGVTVLLHGDFYPGSWLLDRDASLVWIIDPEFTFTGPAEFDLGVCLAHLLMCGFELNDASRMLRSYEAIDGFSIPLTRQFAGVEVLRRLLGVARLPLALSEIEQIQLAAIARQLVTQPTP